MSHRKEKINMPKLMVYFCDRHV